VAIGAGAVQPGSFTRITTPSGPADYLSLRSSGTSTDAHFQVSGVTSTDITEVDILCLSNAAMGQIVTTLATGLSVTDGDFTTEATFPNGDLPAPCRLIALPTGTDPATGYLAAYRGPVIYPEDEGLLRNSDGVTYAGLAADSQGDGLSIAGDVFGCDSILDIVTTALPDLRQEGPPTVTPGCFNTLEGLDIVTTGVGQASPITIDHRNAYQPAAVNDILIGSDNLKVTQPKDTVTFHRAANHDMTMTESAPLMRCGATNEFPPTATSCPKLVPTGVSYTRIYDETGGGHQVRTQDTFTSTDGKAHVVALDVGSVLINPPAGATGFMFPHNGTTFATLTHGKVIKKLGTKAATVLIRSDIDASATDSQATTFAITWSRAPSQIDAPATDGGFGLGMFYSLKVPAHGTATLGMALSQATTTSGALALAKQAVATTIAAPSISKPKSGATVHGKKTTITGSVANGRNGAVTSVTVAGHKAKLTVGAKATKFTVTVTESLGTHTLKVVATDSGGNTASRTVKVRNVG
jgi:hypothetical protein